jgi:hypothetical protein
MGNLNTVKTVCMSYVNHILRAAYLPNLILYTYKYKTVPVYAIKAYRGIRVQLHLFLTSALDGGECSTLHSGRFSSGKEPGTH